MAAKVDDFPIGRVKRLIWARVAAVAYLYGVMSGGEGCLDGFMVGERAQDLVVNRDLKPAPSKFDTEPNFVRHPKGC
jgi:hypothetical protein